MDTTPNLTDELAQIKAQLAELKTNSASEAIFANFAPGMYKILSVHRSDIWIKKHAEISRIAKGDADLMGSNYHKMVIDVYCQVIDCNSIYKEFAILYAYYIAIKKIVFTADIGSFEEVGIFVFAMRRLINKIADALMEAKLEKDVLISEIQSIALKCKEVYQCWFEKLRQDFSLFDPYCLPYKKIKQEGLTQEQWELFLGSEYSVFLPYCGQIILP